MNIVNFVKGDLLESDATIIIQQCNCFATQGAGLAKQIVKKWPSVLEVDKNYPLAPVGDKKRLGYFSIAEVEPKKYVVNMYSQYRYGRGKQHTDYKAMKHALNLIIVQFTHMGLENIKFALPYNIGSGLAGGEWTEVLKIILDTFTKQNWPVYIYSLKDTPELKYFEIADKLKEKSKELGIKEGFSYPPKVKKLIKFAGHTGDVYSKAILSNWFPSMFSEDALYFYTVEQYMMYQKALLFQDDEIAGLIINESDPKKCKALGRKVSNFNPSIWNDNKIDIVTNGLYLKFNQNEVLKETLMNLYTPDSVFVECAPWDKIWGIGLPANDPRSNFPDKWLGQNLLGICLTSVAHSFYEENNIPKYYIGSSYNEKKDLSSWSYINILNKNITTSDSGLSNGLMGKTTGEMMGIMKACIHAIQSKYKEIDIVIDGNKNQEYLSKDLEFDSEILIEKMAKDYRDFINNKIVPNLNINFIDREDLEIDNQIVKLSDIKSLDILDKEI